MCDMFYRYFLLKKKQEISKGKMQVYSDCFHWNRITLQNLLLLATKKTSVLILWVSFSGN